MKNGLRNIYRLGIIIFIISIISIDIFAGEKTGTSSGAFLKISPLPTVSGIGNAYTSLFLGAGSMAYNPAGIFSANSIDLVFSYNKWFGDINHNYFGAVYNSEYGSFGFSLINLSTGDMEITTPDHIYGTGENFRASEYAFGVSYSCKFTDKLHIGATAKIIKSYLFDDNYSDAAYCFDVGTIYNLNKKINFGIALKNLGSDLKYLNESYNLPASLSIGLSGTERINSDHEFLWSSQILRYSDSDENYSIGIEYNYKKMLFIRSGYKFAFGNESGSNTENISCGLGFNQTISDILFKLDYSFTNYKYLPGVHRLSIQIEI